VLDGSKSEIKK